MTPVLQAFQEAKTLSRLDRNSSGREIENRNFKDLSRNIPRDHIGVTGPECRRDERFPIS